MAVDSQQTPRISSPATKRAPTVVLVAGAGRVTTFPITRGRVVIGRALDCDVAIPHAALSRHHAEVLIGPPLTVRDLGSTNGTRLDRTLHRAGVPVALAIGDGFHIGPFFLTVLDDHPTGGSSAVGRDMLRIDRPEPDCIPAVVRDIARTDVSVLVLGETGVGKEVLSQTLHTLSERRGPLQRINCAALAESLVESELFGHEKGAFTGATQDKQGLLEAARGGTVFLDEIGELPLALQAKLLRAVEAREVIRIGGARPIAIDVRFVAATHRELAAEVAAGRFRRDLFYRLDGVSLRISPLRERRGQIAELARRFAAAAAGKLGKATPMLSHAVLAKLESYAWPGNVRELKAVVERAVLLAGDREIRPSQLVIASVDPVAETSVDARNAEPPLSPQQAEERTAIIAALATCGGNQTRAARLLGVARSTLATKLALYRVPRPRAR